MSQHPGNQKKPLSPAAARQAALLFVNTIILIAIYFGTQNIGQPIISMIVTGAYWLILAVFAIVYVAYNRGFTRKGITVDMLPDSWSYEKKYEYVEDAKRRQERSKWMLAVIIPFMITVLIDAVYLFTWPMVQNLFNIM